MAAERGERPAGDRPDDVGTGPAARAGTPTDPSRSRAPAGQGLLTQNKELPESFAHRASDGSGGEACFGPDRGVAPTATARSTGLGLLGLSAVEERVYRQIVAAGGGTARVTARVLRLPPAEAEQALQRLQALTLVTRAGTETLSFVPGEGVAGSGSQEVYYVPEPPAGPLGAMLQTQAAGLISAGATVEQLAHLYGRRQPSEAGCDEMARVVVGTGVNGAVYEMLCAARVEILNLDRQPFVRPVDPYPLLPAMLDVLERGVAVRTIYAGDTFRVARYHEYIQQACGLGEQARLLAHLPIRFVVADGASAILPLAAEGPWVTAALVVHGPTLVEDLVNTFEDLWSLAALLTSDQAEDDAFGEEELALLRMMSTDMTDTAISRHLGTSPRTIGLRLSRLQHKLGAQTRFGMGVEATRRGLL